jgi:hypothetical protein
MDGRTQRLFSWVESEGSEFKEQIKKYEAESSVVECGAESETCGTATLFRHTTLEVQKSLSTKCLLHKKYLQTIFIESIRHAWLTFSAHVLALERKKKKIYKYWHIFSQEVWFYDVMPMG